MDAFQHWAKTQEDSEQFNVVVLVTLEVRRNIKGGDTHTGEGGKVQFFPSRLFQFTFILSSHVVFPLE